MKFDVLGAGFRAYLLDALGNKNTADRYYFAVKRLLADIQFNRLAEVPREALEARLEQVRRKSDYSAAKNGLCWLRRYDETLQLPDEAFLKAVGSQKRNFSSRPAKTLYLDTIRKKVNALQNEKLKYAYRLMMVSGLRVSEAAGLKKEDIHIAGGKICVEVRRGKGGSNGLVECMEDPYLAEQLKRYLEQFQAKDEVFYSAATMKRRAGELGLECHDFRRMAAIMYRKEELQEHKKPIREANEGTREFLRHVRFSTTKRYLFNRKLKVKKRKAPEDSQEGIDMNCTNVDTPHG